jgi:hypothetical protein
MCSPFNGIGLEHAIEADLLTGCAEQREQSSSESIEQKETITTLDTPDMRRR